MLRSIGIPIQGNGWITKSRYIDTYCEQFINTRKGGYMGAVIYDGDDFKRMMRTDMLKLQRLVDSKKTGIFEVDYKDGKIKVEIKKRNDDIVVKRWRSS
jgi:ribosomal protein L25 (general stress protein Ctc)